jgi:ABC-2 type transport system ATP-binding protein
VIVEMPITERFSKSLALEIWPSEPVIEVGQTLHFSTRKLDQLIGTLTKSGVSLEGIQIRQPNLEDLFISLTGKILRS